MWKIALLFGVLLTLVCTQNTPIAVECNYEYNAFNDYTCVLTGIEVLNEEAEIQISGVHLDDHTDDDVLALQIRDSNTPFIIQQFFGIFPNLHELDVENSNLQSINIPETVQLIWFIVYGNNISRIENGSIRGQDQLIYLELVRNGIQTIDEDAFVELGNLRMLVLHDNEISEIVGRTFHPLTNALYIDLEQNNLVSLHDHTFLENQNLNALYLEFNSINAIHPNWVQELQQTLHFVNLVGNQCVNRVFSLQTDEGWAEMHENLQNCYSNFDSPPLECNYMYNSFNDYTCVLSGIEVLNEDADVRITGVHLDDHTDEDVIVLQIRDSNTPFVIQPLFEIFPNLQELDIENSNLQSINIPETVQLIWFIVYGNNISRIENGSIRGQDQMTYLELVRNGIRTIDEDAFADLGNLRMLVLHDNEISDIVGRTFHPLTNALFIDLERNNLVSLHDHTFLENQNLNALYLEFNSINAIHPNWVQEVQRTLRFVNLVGNQCVDRIFSLQTAQGWAEMHEALETCYNNFNGTMTRRITLEFSGPMIISDEFGNILARI